MWIIPGRHSGKLDSVFDDVVDFLVAETLRRSRPQVGHPRIKIAADLGFSAAVDSVAGRALGKKGLPALLHSSRSCFKWILQAALVAGNGKTSDGPRQGGFRRRRDCIRAEASPHHKRKQNGSDSYEYEKSPQESLENPHSSSHSVQ